MQRKVMKQQKFKKNERKYKLTLFECVLPFCAIGGLRVKSCSAYHLNQSSSSLKFFDAFCQFQRLQTLIFHEIFSMPCMLFLSCELLISLHSLQNSSRDFMFVDNMMVMKAFTSSIQVSQKRNWDQKEAGNKKLPINNFICFIKLTPITMRYANYVGFSFYRQQQAWRGITSPKVHA